MNLQIAYDFNDPTIANYIFTEIIHSLGRNPDLFHEVGTPTLKAGGMEIVKIFSYTVRRYNSKLIVDSKTADVPKIECEKFFKEAGADFITAMAFSTNENIKEAIVLAKEYERAVIFDLDSYVSYSQKAKRAEEIIKLGATYINCHTGISAQRAGGTPFSLVEKVYNVSKKYPDSKIVVAGGLKLDNIERLESFKDEIEISIVGSAITNSADPVEQTRLLLKKIRKL